MSAETRKPKKRRPDWGLLMFIIPLGILLMFIFGQIAVRLLPRWSVNAGMNSNLDPNSNLDRPFSLLPPIISQILTPMGWDDYYLTPGADVLFPPFFVFEPGDPAPYPTEPVTQPPTEPSPKPSATTPVVVVPPTTEPPGTNPPKTERPTQPPTDAPTNPPPTDPPTQPPTNPPPTDPPTNPPPTDPPPTDPPPTDPPPTDPPPTDPPPTGYPSTPPPGYVFVDPPPSNVVNPPGGPNDNATGLQQGRYWVFDISSSPIIVDGNGDWELVYYEMANGSVIYLDNVIIGISQVSNASSFYVIFNWGDLNNQTTNDLNTNLVGKTEKDNAQIPLSDLYDYPVPPSTGVLINADGAASQPPNGTYNYLIVISPIKPSTEDVDVDAIVIFP